jgi:cyclopropane fatty-acyl-phospholipid synthase-like methyltransferase
MMEFLKRCGFSKVAGVDVSEEQIHIAAKKGLDVKVADALDYLHQVEEKFSAVIALDFFEHFTKEELMKLGPAVNSALQENGLLVIQTVNGAGLLPNNILYGDLTHSTIFTPTSLQQLLRLHNFDNFMFQESGPVAKNAKGTARLFLWRLVRLIPKAVYLIETGKTQDIWTENMICCCRKS